MTYVKSAVLLGVLLLAGCQTTSGSYTAYDSIRAQSLGYRLGTALSGAQYNPLNDPAVPLWRKQMLYERAVQQRQLQEWQRTNEALERIAVQQPLIGAR